MPNPLAVTVQASAAQAASGVSATKDLFDPAFATDGLKRCAATLLLDVTAASGTAPSLTVVLETSPSGSSWEPVLTFDPTSTVGFQRLKTVQLERYIRARWTVTGTTPSFTFSIDGTAEVIYADADDFYGLGLPKAATLNVDPVDLLARCLIAASSQANAQIPRAYALPLKQPYPDSLKSAVCAIAAMRFLSQRGFDANDPADKEVDLNDQAARKWLSALGNGVTPDWIDASPTTTDAGAYIVTSVKRGW